jgi:hypothetical protein
MVHRIALAAAMALAAAGRDAVAQSWRPNITVWLSVVRRPRSR